MQFYLFKSILSIFLLFLGVFASLVMYELLGRRQLRYDAQKLKWLHKTSGRFFLFLSLFISLLCVGFIIIMHSHISLRGAIHSILATGVLVVLFIKIAVVYRYRQHYRTLPVLGILLLGLTAGTFVSSTVYYLAAAQSMTVAPASGLPAKQDKETAGTVPKMRIRTDQASILRGKGLYNTKCSFCHDINSTTSGVGPGHKGLLRNPLLPFSNKPATPENIAAQIRNPYKDMPAFPYLSDDEIADLIAYMNTL